MSETKYNADYIFKCTAADRVFIPSMAIPFYYHIYSKGKVPSEVEFFDLFIKMYCGANRITKDDYSSISTIYVKEIIHRSYPSFIRDFHFYLLLSEDAFFDSVSYSVRSDVAYGIAISVKKDGHTYTIGVFLESAKSRSFLQEKMSSVDIPISVQFDKTSAYQVGKFSLCGKDHVDLVKFSVSSPISKW